MQSTEQQPDITEKSQHLTPSNFFELTPEAHGKLCGFLCAGLKTDGKAWLELVIGSVELDECICFPQRGMLIKMYNHIFRQLVDSRFEFHPLLVDADENLTVRAEALSCWCYGYLSGLHHAGIDMSRSSIEDLQEMFYRFTEISNIDYEEVDIRPEDESAFMDVLTYIRTSVIHIYQEVAKPSIPRLH